MAAPIVTLTTDFGEADPYVAQIKGVLLSMGPPDLRVVDLSHALPAQDVRAAACFVAAAVPRFPAGTVHVVVVDPGVGSARAILLAETEDQWVVAPDNGLLTLLLREHPPARLLAMDTRQPGATAVSSTFHGRDLFAPVAARLASGEDPATLGAPVSDVRSVVALPFPEARRQGAVVRGQVLHVDRFGNLITNVERATVAALSKDAGHVWAVVGGRRVGPLRDHYAQVAVGEAVLLWDSAGRLEIAVREGSAEETMGVTRDAEVLVEAVGAPGGATA